MAGFVFVNEDAEVLLLATYLDNNFPLLNALFQYYLHLHTCVRYTCLLIFREQEDEPQDEHEHEDS